MAYIIKEVSDDIRGGSSKLATVESFEAARQFLATRFEHHSIQSFDIDEDFDAADAFLVPASSRTSVALIISIEAE